MAQTKVINLEVNTNAKSLKAQLREAQAEVQTLSDKFGATSKEAINAAKKAAELKDAIGDAKNLTDAFNPDAKFNALSQSIGGVLNGFQAFEGALGLVGVEGEAVQETLLKVQSAMALSQGLQGLGEARDSFKALGAVAKNALSGIRAGIAATGIGLLVIALGTIVAYWEDIKELVNGVSDEQDKLNEKTALNLDIEKRKLNTIGDQDNILRLQGKSEKQILEYKIKQTDEVIKASEIQLQQTIATQKAQVDAAKRNKDILEGMIRFIQTPLRLLLTAVDSVGKAFGKNFGLADGLFDTISSFFFDPEETKREGDKVIQEQKEALAKLKNDRAGMQIAINNIDKQAYTERKAIRDEESRERKEKADREAKDRIEQYAKDNLDFYSYEIAKNKRLKEIEEERAKEKQEALDKEALAVRNYYQGVIDEAKREEEAHKTLQQAKFDTAKNTFTLIGNLATLFAGKSEKEQRKAFEIQKAANIANTLMDTWSSATAAFKSMATIPVVGPALGGVAAASAVAAGLANVKNISNQQFGGGASGNSPSPNMNSGSVVTPRFNIIGANNQSQLSNLNQAPIKAYVVGSEVTTQQMLDKKKIQNATL